MNKDLFKIESDEVRRILSLHEERTKTQYLNIILEQPSQDNSSYTLTTTNSLENTQFNGLELKLFKGTKFSKIKNTNYLSTNDNTKYQRPNSVTGVVATTYTGKIMYNCSTGKFFIKGQEKVLFYDESKGLTNNLSQLCQGRLGVYNKQKEGSFTVKSKGDIGVKFGSNTISINDGREINYINNVAKVLNQLGNYYISFKCPNVFKVEQNFGQYSQFNAIPKNHATLVFFQNNFCQAVKPKEVKSNDVVNKQPTSDFKAIYTIQNKHDLGTKQINVGDIIIKSFKFPDYAAIMRGNTAIAYFNCKTNTWSDTTITDTKGALTGTIKQKVCPQVSSSASVDTQTNNTGGTNTGGTNTGGTNTGGTNTGLTNRQSRFIANTQTKINNVQKLLGVTPTGQLDTTQIDTLINKLKGQ